MTRPSTKTPRKPVPSTKASWLALVIRRTPEWAYAIAFVILVGIFATAVLEEDLRGAFLALVKMLFLAIGIVMGLALAGLILALLAIILGHVVGVSVRYADKKYIHLRKVTRGLVRRSAKQSRAALTGLQLRLSAVSNTVIFVVGLLSAAVMLIVICILSILVRIFI